MDGVVHAAAKVSVSGEWADYERINIGGTRVMLQAAVNHSVRTFLYISSPSVAHAGAAIVGDGAGEASRSTRAVTMRVQRLPPSCWSWRRTAPSCPAAGLCTPARCART